METCKTCGAERRRSGVLYPTRLLCPCEERTCGVDDCEARARVVEFQKPIPGAEPKLPAKANSIAMFYCTEHAPEDSIPQEEAPKRSSKPKLPNVDPQWTWEEPPVSAVSHDRVECAGCKDVHELRSRKMHNGSRSKCPKCGYDIYTYAFDTEEAAR